MPNQWLCSICHVFLALTLRLLVRHVAMVHAIMPNFRIKCCVNDCPLEYTKIDSFRKHLRRHHADVLNAEEELLQHSGTTVDTVNENETEGGLSSSSESDHSDVNINEDDELISNGNGPRDGNFEGIDLKDSAAQFLLKLQTRSKISKTAVNNVIQDSSILVARVVEHIKQRVVNCLSDNSTSENTIDSVRGVFDSFEDPFLRLQTTKLQTSFIQTELNIVNPVQYVIGSQIAFKNNGPKRVICEREDTMVYIPIIESLELLLSNNKILDIVLKPSEDFGNGVFYDICHGELIKNHPIFKAHPDALQVVLYHDEVEVCNPLGSHVGKHKIDLYYYTLANINPKFRSKLSAIQLLAIVKAKDVTKYGQEKILLPLVNDLNKIAGGHTFKLPGQTLKLYGAVAVCLGDTEGQHQWGGFKVKVGWAHQKCRNCLCTFVNMQQHFRDNYFTARTSEQYITFCEDIDNAPTAAARQDLQSNYGIEERSLLTKLCSFDLTKQLPQDIMHILLEGVVQYEARYILQHLFDNSLLTLRQFNNSFNQLPLGYHDENNRPPPLRSTVFTGQEKYKLKQTAAQAWIFLKNVPYVLMHYVPFENEYYKLLLQLILIVQICFSPVLSDLRINELQDLIESHLKKFRELFPAVNITPKMHYLIHVPQQARHLGPPIRHSCARFEAKHQYFKEMARLQNFKNISLSLAERCQLDQCGDFCMEDPNSHPLFTTTKELGPVKGVDGVIYERFIQRVVRADLFVNAELIDAVFKVKWIKLFGTKYDSNHDCILAVDASFVEKTPQFGQLENIWLVNEEIVFEYIPLKTLKFDKNFMAYKVEKVICHSELCLYSRMMDFSLYTLQVVKGTDYYVSIKYDLKDIIEQHIVGDNPLHS